MASFPARIYLCCLKPCNPSGPNSCLITLLGCLLSSGWEILAGLSRMGFSCSSSGLALPMIHFQASAYSASRCTRDLTGRAGLLVELGLLTTPMLVGFLRMRICGGAPWEGYRPESQWALWRRFGFPHCLPPPSSQGLPHLPSYSPLSETPSLESAVGMDFHLE